MKPVISAMCDVLNIPEFIDQFCWATRSKSKNKYWYFNKGNDYKCFDVTFGDPKSKRKDLNQTNIGLFVQQDGLPIGGTGLAGNTSDVIWFREAM